MCMSSYVILCLLMCSWLLVDWSSGTATRKQDLGSGEHDVLDLVGGCGCRLLVQFMFLSVVTVTGFHRKRREAAPISIQGA
jgi:hypothetical protein